MPSQRSPSRIEGQLLSHIGVPINGSRKMIRSHRLEPLFGGLRPGRGQGIRHEDDDIYR